jgi:hypothetical protein
MLPGARTGDLHRVIAHPQTAPQALLRGLRIWETKDGWVDPIALSGRAPAARMPVPALFRGSCLARIGLACATVLAAAIEANVGTVSLGPPADADGRIG